MNNIVYLAHINNKIYVGITSQRFSRRINEHKSRARNGTVTHFYNALRKNNMIAEWEIVYQSKDYDAIKEVERFYIDLYHANDPKFGYNHTMGGDGTVGYKHTEEQCKKNSNVKKVVMNKPEIKEKIKIGQREWRNTESFRSAIHKGGNFFKTEQGKLVASERQKLSSQQNKGIFGRPWVGILAKREDKEIQFESLSDAAKFFGCVSNTVKKYIGKEYQGWNLIRKDLYTRGVNNV